MLAQDKNYKNYKYNDVVVFRIEALNTVFVNSGRIINRTTILDNLVFLIQYNWNNQYQLIWVCEDEIVKLKDESDTTIKHINDII